VVVEVYPWQQHLFARRTALFSPEHTANVFYFLDRYVRYETTKVASFFAEPHMRVSCNKPKKTAMIDLESGERRERLQTSPSMTALVKEALIALKSSLSWTKSAKSAAG
jgi:hypothetical protein